MTATIMKTQHIGRINHACVWINSRAHDKHEAVYISGGGKAHG